MVERWHQLPIDRALAGMPVVLAVVQQLADEVADEEGRARLQVPDLGPAVVMDQLTVMVHDVLEASAAPHRRQVSAVVAASGKRPPQHTHVADVTGELATLRRAL